MSEHLQTFDREALFRRIAELDMRARKMVQSRALGGNVTRTQGSGLVFDQLRDYQQGDDYRTIDWKSSVRAQKMIVRSYHEERQKTITLILDTSLSGAYGSTQILKHDVMREISVLLACAAWHKKDSLGIVCCAEKVVATVPAAKGHQHMMHCAEKLFTAPLQGTSTALSEAFEYLLQQKTKQHIIIIITDGLADDYQSKLPELAVNNDVMMVRVQDALEQAFPTNFVICLEDIETGFTSGDEDGSALLHYMLFLEQHRQKQDTFLRQYGIDCLDITVGQPFDDLLVRFFNERI